MRIRNKELGIRNKELGMLVIALIVAGSLLLVIGHRSFVSDARAQTAPQLILTWQAMNFYPSDYEGKAYAAPQSPIVLSAMIVENNKIRSARGVQFTWHLDGKFFERGVGLQEVLFTNKKLRGDEYFVRVVADLDGRSMEAAITLPILSQRVVIEAPTANGVVSRGDSIILSAIPYFFNVGSFNDLAFFWQIDGQTQENERTNELLLEVSDSAELIGREMFITSIAGNNTNPLESARSNLRITIR